MKSETWDPVTWAGYRRALDAATTVVRAVRPDQLDGPSPCLGWDLRALLAHMIGQNHGFAAAVEEADEVPVAAFAPRSFDDAGLATAWDVSVDRVVTAFAASPGERDVLLVELSTERPFPVETVLGFHLLDTVVHTWDVATAIGRGFRPDDDLAELVARQASRVPTGPGREQPGAAFAPPVPVSVSSGTDPWVVTLARLGRRG